MNDELNLRHAAINYLLKGYSVLPLIGKVCPMGWTLYQQQRATASEIRWWEGEGWLQNLGVICGPVSGNLVVIDLDGAPAVTLFQQRFPDYLRDTYVVRTGSGLHVWLKADNLPANRKVSLGSDHNGIEIRAQRQYVVAPPSIHPDTHQPYETAVRKPVWRIFDLSEVNAWLDTLAAPTVAPAATKAPQQQQKSEGQPLGKGQRLLDRNGAPVRSPKMYAAQSLYDEAGRISRKAHGMRNDELNAAAFRMAQFIRLGLLTDTDVENALVQATRSWTDSDQSEAQIRRTIRSGLTRGLDKPDTQRRYSR